MNKPGDTSKDTLREQDLSPVGLGYEFLRALESRENIPPEEAADALAVLDEIASEVASRVQTPKLEPYEQLTPAYTEASIIMEEGRENELKILEENEKKEKEIAGVLKELLESLADPSVTIGDNEKGEIDSMFRALAKDLLNLKRPTLNDIMRILGGLGLVRNTYKISGEKLENLLTDKASPDFKKREDLVAKLGGKLKVEDISIGFKRLRKDFHTTRILNLEHIWRESTDNDGENDIFKDYGEAANNICAELLGNYTFHGEVRNQNDLKMLKELASMEPNNEKTFEIYKSACVKLELMHILYYLKAQVETPYLKAVAKRLAERLKRIIDKQATISILNPPTSDTDKGNHHCEIDRCEVDHETKTPASLIRKIILEEIQHPTSVPDLVRARIFLPQYVSYRDEHGKKDWNKTSLHKEITKVVAIILAEFGTDYDAKRIKYSLESGGTKIYSQGNHRGVHLTFKFRFQIPEAGIHRGGIFKEAAEDVELQILGYMSQEEEKRDHATYVAGQADYVKEKLGINMTFGDFVMQLAEVVNLDYDFHNLHYPDPSEKTGNRPFNKENYREKMLLLNILTRRDTEGNLVNLKTIKEICENSDMTGTVLLALRKMISQKKEEIEIRGIKKDITKGIRAKAHEAHRILKNKDFAQPIIGYEIKQKGKKGDELEIRKTKTYESGKPVELETRPYVGPLYMLRKTRKENNTEISEIYTVSSVEARSAGNGGTKISELVLTHRIEKFLTTGTTRCYAMKEGKEKLLWSTTPIQGQEKEYMVIYEKDPEGVTVETDKKTLEKINLNPYLLRSTFGKHKNRLAEERNKAISNFVTRKLKPKVQKGYTLIPL